MKKYLLEFHEKINTYEDYNYLRAVLRLNLASTLSGLKLGTMVNLTNGSRKSKNIWNKYKNIYMKDINLNYYILREDENSVLILFYDRKLLEERLNKISVKNFLVSFGYDEKNNLEENLKNLKLRFFGNRVCPNEVGIFLGYPLEDVKDFHCSNEKCKLTGYWCCYNNTEYSKKEFEKYDLEKLKYIKCELDGKRAV